MRKLVYLLLLFILLLTPFILSINKVELVKILNIEDIPIDIMEQVASIDTSDSGYYEFAPSDYNIPKDTMYFLIANFEFNKPKLKQKTHTENGITSKKYVTISIIQENLLDSVMKRSNSIDNIQNITFYRIDNIKEGDVYEFMIRSPNYKNGTSLYSILNKLPKIS